MTVTGAQFIPNEGVVFHQMVLESLDLSTDSFLVQNSLHSHGGSLLRIPRWKEYFLSYDFFHTHSQSITRTQTGFTFSDPNKGYMRLVDDRNMNPDEWYLFPQAYKITLTPP